MSAGHNDEPALPRLVPQNRISPGLINASRRSYCFQIDFDTIAGAFDSKPIGGGACRPFYFITKAFHV